MPRTYKGGELLIIGDLGTGAYGKVKLAQDRLSGKYVALKMIDTGQVSDDGDDIVREVSFLLEIKSPSIVEYYGSAVSEYVLALVMEYMDAGSVTTLLTNGGALPEAAVAVITRSLLIGLNALHSNRIVHRDIKSSNILLSSQGYAKICDMGVSTFLRPHLPLKGPVGTVYYMAPEVAGGHSYDTKADIWSLGITIFEMITGNVPHADLPPQCVIDVIPTAPCPRVSSKSPVSSSKGSVQTRGFSGTLSAGTSMSFVSSTSNNTVSSSSSSSSSFPPLLLPSAAELLSLPFVRRAGSRQVLIQLLGQRGMLGQLDRMKREHKAKERERAGQRSRASSVASSQSYSSDSIKLDYSRETLEDEAKRLSDALLERGFARGMASNLSEWRWDFEDNWLQEQEEKKQKKQEEELRKKEEEDKKHLRVRREKGRSMSRGRVSRMSYSYGFTSDSIVAPRSTVSSSSSSSQRREKERRDKERRRREQAQREKERKEKERLEMKRIQMEKEEEEARRRTESTSEFDRKIEKTNNGTRSG
ncbi:hypothetical protein ADUPG1_006902, partial [Aduncisulcus paluster]